MALNATYADMALRGSPPSAVPAQVAEGLADSAGVDLGFDETRQNRESGLGALADYVVGLAIGTAYGPHTAAPGESVKMRIGVALGLGAMAESDVPAAALGVTESTTWVLYAGVIPNSAAWLTLPTPTTSFLTPILTPTHPNIIRLRPTPLD